ncbi:MAG TPA: hypothetical protein VGB30_03435 [bacterium]|jgi:hypothetical protein
MSNGGEARPTGKKPDKLRWVQWALIPMFFLIYSLHLTNKFYFDGVVFASIIEHGPPEKLFNPHHLLYSPLFYLIHRVLEGIFGPHILALKVMQWGNVLIGSIGVALLWGLIRRLAHDQGLAILVTLLGCFSFTWWHYSTDADVYMLSTLFLILAADRVEIVSRQRAPKNSDFIYIGIMQALSVLFHQLNVFFVVCVAACLFWKAIEGTKEERWRWWWTYTVSLAIPVATAYIAIGTIILGHTDFQSFMYWITEYGHESDYWIKSWTEIPLGTLNGYLMVFFHRATIDTSILDYDLRLAMEEGRIWKGVIKKVFGYYSLGFLFYCYLAALYNMKKYAAQYPKAAVFMLSWLAPYVIFQFFFMPTNYFYKLFIFVPLLTSFAWYGTVVITLERSWLKYLLFGLFIGFTGLTEPVLALIVLIFAVIFEVMRKYKNVLYRWGLFIMVAFLPMYNFIAGVQPESKVVTNPEVANAMELAHEFKDGDLLIFEGGYDYPDGWIISALTPARVITLTDLYEMSDDEEKEYLDDAATFGWTVYVHPNIIEGGEEIGRAAEKLGVTVTDLQSLIDQYQTEPAFQLDGRTYNRLIID